MGIYYDHGLEYRFIANGKIMIICSSKDADERLLKSTYFAKRKNEWFSNSRIEELLKTPELCQEVPDIELNCKEKERLRIMTEDFSYGHHGWYEIATCSCLTS
jgi:hypothetical protein